MIQMPSYQISLTPTKRAAGRLIALVRREIQKALAEEHAEHGTTQASIAAALDVNRSVIHRQVMGLENMTIGRVGEIANVLGREVQFSLVKPEDGSGNQYICASTLDGRTQSPTSDSNAVFAFGVGEPQGIGLAPCKA
jgi:hypothetical protein